MRDYVEERAALIASAEPSLDVARELAALTDAAVCELSGTAPTPRGRYALVALGGWGAGALLPKSDLDLLVLYDGRPAEIKPFVEAVLYPLWDAGLKVGHQVRTPKEHVRATADDIETLTASLTGRPLCGDTQWAEKSLAEVARAARKRQQRILRALASRERPGSPYLLEPELKGGCGGRRDYDELTWYAAVLSGVPAITPDALVVAGVLTPEEMTRLRSDAAVIAAARFSLQREGFGDRFSLEATDVLGVDPERLQLALAETALVLDDVRKRLADGAATVTHPGTRDCEPLDASEVLQLLSAGTASLPVLQRGAQEGRLEHLIPGVRALMTCRRPGLGHELTVGAHDLKAAALLAELPAGGTLGRSRDLAAADPTLVVATLVHDIGKTVPGPGHPERGAAPARDAGLRFGLTDREADNVAELVRLHLILAESAFGRDIDDEDEVLRVAARIGEAGLLPGLHLLTAVDSIATGSSMWGPWQEALIGSLVGRLDAALSSGVEGAGLATEGERVRSEALRVLGDDPARARERRFVERASLRYLAATSPAAVAQHAHMAAEVAASPAAIPAALGVHPGPVPGSHVATVVAPDRPELFARIAGAIALSGLDILAADAHAAPDRLALDVFVVTSATRRPIEHATWTTLERYLRAALQDRLELETRLAERRKHYPPTVDGSITVGTETGGGSTAVRVTAPDRPGLLYDLARAVSATGLDIRRARILTIEGTAKDTFHVTGRDGQPVDDPGVIGHLAMRLREIG